MKFFNDCFVIVMFVFFFLKRRYLLGKMFSYAEGRTFNTAAIASNSPTASNIGLEILKKGGTAADAAIAVLLCEGVTNPQSMGVGGGFLLTIYRKDTHTVEVLNARECAPANANKNMYSAERNHDISEGGLAVAIPAELKGYWELHKRYGKLEWKDLFSPTIKLCRSGIVVTKYTSNAIQRMQRNIEKSPTLAELFYNKKTGSLYKEGDLICRPKLADTLTAVALNGPDVLYNGPLTDDFIKDICDHGGIITKNDLQNYKPMWQPPISLELPNNLVVYSVPPPGSGSILFTILESLSKLFSEQPALFWHRLIEVWKFSFGLKAQIGGPILHRSKKFVYNNSYVDHVIKTIDDSKTYHDSAHYSGNFMDVPDDGTCHISLLAPNGDAISVTSTINDGLGAAFISSSTGIILNNEMMDFSIPFFYPWDLNPANFIEPYKQPMSSMCPAIIVNKNTNQVRLVIGGAGGFRIITATTQVIARNIFMKENLLVAVSSPRLHHQLIPMRVEFEDTFEENILKGLKRKGHQLRLVRTRIQTDNGEMVPILPSVNAISIEDSKIYSVGDPRRFASGVGY